MGRLFWKFFLAILLAQMVTTIGVGVTFWLWDQARDRPVVVGTTPLIDTTPSAQAIVAAAAFTLAHGGIADLRELVSGVTSRSIYVIDGNGREVLGRTVTSAMRAQAEQLQSGILRDTAVRKLTAGDGQVFLVFVRRAEAADGPPHRGGPEPGFRGPPPDLPSRPAGEGSHPPHGPRVPYVPLAIGTLASLLFAALLAWYFSRPIRALRSAFEAAASGDLAPRFSTAKAGPGDELVDLGRDFDRMSGQLRALIDNQRRLLHDVSHELRSPLARLQAAIGLAHQQPDKLADSLERIERESIRMDKLVDELLTLARLESAFSLPLAEDIALMELVEEITGDANFEAESQHRHVMVRGAATVQVHGSPDLLWRAIENVVRNAIKHSPDGGIIEIVPEVADGKAILHVLDRGPGIAAADLDSIFQPFFRSHPLANNIDGHGLGLAIARRVIQAHGGTITAGNREDGGLRVTIVLPASPRPV